MRPTDSLDIGTALETIGGPEHAPAAGSAAALAGALAAATIAKAARASSRPASAAQAASLQERLVELAGTDAAALAEARAALAGRVPEGGDERRDFALGVVLRRALEAPRRIAESCADVAALAAGERELVLADHRADLDAAAAIAAGAARAAAHLAEVNLSAAPGDAEVAAARLAAQAAEDVVEPPADV